MSAENKVDNIIGNIEEQREVQKCIRSLIDDMFEKSMESKLQSLAENKWKDIETKISIKHSRLVSGLEECQNEIRELSENIKCMRDFFDEMKTDIECFKKINKENTIIWQKFEGKLKLSCDKLSQIEKKMTNVTKTLSPPNGGSSVKGQKRAEESKSNSLESRLSTLEASVGKALEVMFPRVELLLSKMNQEPCTEKSRSNSDANFPTPVNELKPNDTADRPVKKGKDPEHSEKNVVQNSKLCYSCVAGGNASISNSSKSLSVLSKPRTCTVANLLNAAKSGRVDEVCALLDSGINVNAYNEDGITALHVTAEFGHVKILEHLLARGANVNAGDSDGMTPIFNAASNCHVKCVTILLQGGADVNIVAEEGITVLHRVALCGDRKTMEAVLAAGAEIGAADNRGWTALHWAAAWGSAETTNVLLGTGMWPSVEDLLCLTPLHWAVVNGRKDTAGLLLISGASFSEVKKANMTPAEVASCNEIIKSLRREILQFSGNCSGLGSQRAGFVTKKSKFKS